MFILIPPKLLKYGILYGFYPFQAFSDLWSDKNEI